MFLLVLFCFNVCCSALPCVHVLKHVLICFNAFKCVLTCYRPTAATPRAKPTLPSSRSTPIPKMPPTRLINWTTLESGLLNSKGHSKTTSHISFTFLCALFIDDEIISEDNKGRQCSKLIVLL